MGGTPKARGLGSPGLRHMLAGAFFLSVMAVLVKLAGRRLRQTDDPLVVVFCFSLVAVPATAPTMIGSFVWPRGWEWAALLGVGVATQLGQVHLTRGLHLERAGRAMSVPPRRPHE